MVTLIIILYLFSLYGWGRTVADYVYSGAVRSWPYSTALGLSLWLLIGGILNALGFAGSASLDSITVIGWCLSLFFLSRDMHKYRSDLKLTSDQGTFFSRSARGLKLGSIMPATIIFLFVLLFFSMNIVPTEAYNYHDDFYKYIHPPYQMLQTGTLGGDHFSMLGYDSVGGQAFFHSFIVNHFPVKYINAFDAVFCFALTGFLLIAIARLLKVYWHVLFFSLSVLVLVNPQIVNISAVYSASVMILGLVFSSCILLESSDRAIKRPLFIQTVPFSLFLVSLALMKTTYIVYAATYFVLFFLMLVILNRNRMRNVLLALYASLGSIVFFLPWVLTHFSNYSSALGNILHKTDRGFTVNDQPLRHLADNSISAFIAKMFSLEELFWGGSYFAYYHIVIILVIVSVFLAFLMHKNVKYINGYAISFIAASISVVLTFVVFSNVTDSSSAIRYIIPIEIAVFAIGVLVLASPVIGTGVLPAHVRDGRRISYPGVIIILILQVSLVLLFRESFVRRAVSALEHHTTLSFPISRKYIEYNDMALSKEARGRILDIQGKTARGQHILAFISMPFHLDYSRNRISVLSETSFVAPWLNLPLRESSETFRKYLMDQGLRYIMWEYRGFSVKSRNDFQWYLQSPSKHYREIGKFNLGLGDMLYKLSSERARLYNNGQIMLYDIAAD